MVQGLIEKKEEKNGKTRKQKQGWGAVTTISLPPSLILTGKMSRDAKCHTHSGRAKTRRSETDLTSIDKLPLQNKRDLIQELERVFNANVKTEKLMLYIDIL